MKLIASSFTTVFALACAIWVAYTVMVLFFKMFNYNNFEKHRQLWNKWYLRLLPVFAVCLIIEIYLGW